MPVLGASPNIFYVPESKQDQVMTYLTNPDYVGCAHMHAIMQFPSKYSVCDQTQLDRFSDESLIFLCTDTSRHSDLLLAGILSLSMEP